MNVLPAKSREAVLAAGYFIPAYHDEVEQLPDRDRDHRKVDAATAHHQRSEQSCGNAASQGANDDREWCARRKVFQRHACAISAKAEVGGLPERQAAGEAKNQIEAH